MSSNRIRHEGVIDSVDGDSVKVRILQTSACAACRVAGHCHASESKEKVVDVFHVQSSSQLKVGDNVVVSASHQVASQALLLGFGIPFLLMVGMLILALRITGDEGLSALAGVLVLAPYYGLLYLLRNRIKGKLAFSLEQ